MRRMIFLAAAATTLLVGCVQERLESATRPNDKLAEIIARGTLIVAAAEDYAPQSERVADALPDPDTKCEPSQYTVGQFKGFDVKVAEQIAARLGVEPCFVTPPWSQLIAGNWGDNWDIHVGSMAITYERMEVLYFSQPYYATPTVVLVHMDNTTYREPEDLSGKRIGVCAGCTFEKYLKGTLQLPGGEIRYRIQDAQIVGYENEDPAIQDLLLGDGVQLDAVITLLPIADQVIAAGQPVKVLNGPLLFTYASIAMDRSSARDVTSLLDEINAIVSDLHENGFLKRLSEKYQGQDLTQEAARYDLSTLNQAP